MLTYKKLLPQGIIGRRTLQNYNEEGSDEESIYLSDGSGDDSKSVTSTNFEDNDDAQDIEHEKIIDRHGRPEKKTHDQSNQSSIDQYFLNPSTPGSSRMATVATSSVDAKISEMEPSYSRHRGSQTSVTTMEDNISGTEFNTQDVIQESIWLSKQKAPGIPRREFPILSQSSIFSQGETETAKRTSTSSVSSFNFSPMKLNRVFGRNDKLPILNLTGIHFSHIVYVASNVVVLLDYYRNHQRMLQGHKNKITCVAKDSMKKYFATGDIGPDSVIIIWNVATGHPYHTFPVSLNRDGNFGVNSIAFVGHEPYIASLGNDMKYLETDEATEDENTLQTLRQQLLRRAQKDDSETEVVEQKKADETQNICIWHVSKHASESFNNNLKDPTRPETAAASVKPAVAYKIPSYVGYQREIEFCEEKPEFFVTTGDRCVVFYTWLKNEVESVISHHVPKRSVKFMSKINKFTTSIWMKQTKWCLTATDTGLIFAWSTPVALGLQPPPNPKLNIKEYKRAFKVGDCAVTSIISHKGLFLIGDELGSVKFFDNKFRILRWTKATPQMPLKPITCIACNHGEGVPDFKKQMQENYIGKEHERLLVKDWTYGGQKYRQPSQTTLERLPFVAPDFVFGCAGGDVFYCHLAESRVDQIVFGTPGDIVAMDTCPNTTHVATSTKDGDVQLFDYITNTLVFSGSMFKKSVEVSCMKFHPSGSFAFFGMTNGQLYFRRAYTFRPMEAPLDNCTACIKKIIFTETGLFMAHYDASYKVTLYLHQKHWILRGKHRSHYKPIVDLVFYNDLTQNKERLFSLGEDRYIIEYDVHLSTQSTGLLILLRYEIDAQFTPTSFVFDSLKDQKPILLVSNSGNKLKFFDQDTQEIKKHCQGPTYGKAVDRMICFKPELEQGRESQFILMTLGNLLGLIKPPIDGNPFKYMAVIGHPGGIQAISVGCRGREIFTCGIEDECLFKWEPNVSALETSLLSGGSGITPFLKMLDFGLPPGQSLALDVENIFYHLLIRRAKDQQDMLNMKVEIPIVDIPLVLRTCGTFLTEQELGQMMGEALENGQMKTGKIPKMISYEDFVKLFANYKVFPAPVIENDIVEAFHILGEDKILDAFQVFEEGEIIDAFRVLEDLIGDYEMVITREKFDEFLDEYGKNVPLSQLPAFLQNLFSQESIFGPAPSIHSLEESEIFEEEEDIQTEHETTTEEEYTEETSAEISTVETEEEETEEPKEERVVETDQSMVESVADTEAADKEQPIGEQATDKRQSTEGKVTDKEQSKEEIAKEKEQSKEEIVNGKEQPKEENTPTVVEAPAKPEITYGGGSGTKKSVVPKTIAETSEEEETFDEEEEDDQ